MSTVFPDASSSSFNIWKASNANLIVEALRERYKAIELFADEATVDALLPLVTTDNYLNDATFWSAMQDHAMTLLYFYGNPDVEDAVEWNSLSSPVTVWDYVGLPGGFREVYELDDDGGPVFATTLFGIPTSLHVVGYWLYEDLFKVISALSKDCWSWTKSFGPVGWSEDAAAAGGRGYTSATGACPHDWPTTKSLAIGNWVAGWQTGSPEVYTRMRECCPFGQFLAEVKNVTSRMHVQLEWTDRPTTKAILRVKFDELPQYSQAPAPVWDPFDVVDRAGDPIVPNVYLEMDRKTNPGHDFYFRTIGDGAIPSRWWGAVPTTSCSWSDHFRGFSTYDWDFPIWWDFTRNGYPH